MEPVARHLLGEPNKEFSDTTELRYGSHGSLAIDLKHGRWYDHEAQVGGGVLDLVARKIGCGNGEAVAWLREQGFEVPGDTPRRRPFAERIVCTYRYRYADGSHAFDVVRLRDPKDFRQRAPDGTWRVKGIRKVLYRLPEILEAPEGATVFFVEGEKDVGRLLELGLRATTSPGGAGKWRDSFAEGLRDLRVVAIPDYDEAGEKHAAAVVASFRRRDVPAAILRLPGLPPKGDASDWLDAGGTPGSLAELAEAALQHDGAGPRERGGQDAAEETADPLDDLVEKSAEDPGAAFTPEVLERLATLKKEDRAAFEALRARLKKAGCRVTALDEAMAEDAGDGGRGPTQADILIDLAGAAELFHSSDGTAFADVMINEHRETWPVRTKGFRRWLARQFFEADRRRAKLRGAAIGAQRDRGEGAFRRTGAAGVHPRRRPRWAALPRSRGTRLGGRWKSTPPAGG